MPAATALRTWWKDRAVCFFLRIDSGRVAFWGFLKICSITWSVGWQDYLMALVCMTAVPVLAKHAGLQRLLQQAGTLQDRRYIQCPSPVIYAVILYSKINMHLDSTLLDLDWQECPRDISPIQYTHNSRQNIFLSDHAQTRVFKLILSVLHSNLLKIFILARSFGHSHESLSTY